MITAIRVQTVRTVDKDIRRGNIRWTQLSPGSQHWVGDLSGEKRHKRLLRHRLGHRLGISAFPYRGYSKPQTCSPLTGTFAVLAKSKFSFSRSTSHLAIT